MRGLRYHLLSLTAAGLGVALGLGVGAGPVAEETVSSADARSDRLAARAAALESKVERLRQAAAADGRVVTALAPPLTAGRLAGRSVLVVATPGAPAGVVRRVRTAVHSAGANVPGVLTLTDVYVDPAKAQAPLEDLALRLVPPGVAFAEDASPIERVGTVLARATVQGGPGQAAPAASPPGQDAGGARKVDRDAAELIAGLEELGAISLDGRPGRRADLAVVVSGRKERAQAKAALAGLLAALDAQSMGAVLTAPGAAEEGPLRWVRDATGEQLENGITTVDSMDDEVGPVVLVLALAERTEGRSGSYGVGRGARAVLPPPAPAG